MTYAEGDYVRVTTGPRSGQKGNVVRVQETKDGTRFYWVKVGAETFAAYGNDLAFAGRFFNGPVPPEGVDQ